MLVVILLYDQLLFRPLVAWADQFRFEQTAAATRRRRGCWTCSAARVHCARLTVPFAALMRGSPLEFAYSGCRGTPDARGQKRPPSRRSTAVWLAIVIAGSRFAAWRIDRYLRRRWPCATSLSAVGLGLVTLARVRRADCAGQPDLGAGRGLDRPAAAGWPSVQPLAQFLAAFPANLLFPVSWSVDRALRARSRMSG